MSPKRSQRKRARSVASLKPSIVTQDVPAPVESPTLDLYDDGVDDLYDGDDLDDWDTGDTLDEGSNE